VERCSQHRLAPVSTPGCYGGDWTVNGVSWSSDGRFLALAGGDVFGDVTEPPSFEIWDVQSNNRLMMQNLGDALSILLERVLISHRITRPYCTRVLGRSRIFSAFATAYVFDAGSSEIIRTFTQGGEALIRSMAWSPDGSQLATGLFSGKNHHLGLSNRPEDYQFVPQ
jgi:WD40 repeat protein